MSLMLRIELLFKLKQEAQWTRSLTCLSCESSESELYTWC